MKGTFLYNNKITDMPIFPSFRFVKPIIGERRVLDVGCGVGRYLENFSEESTGIEFSVPSIKKCRKKGLKVIRGDVNKGLSVKSKQFEVIFASHIIEHVESPFYFLEEANRVLKPNGMIILGFPVEKSLARVFGDHYFDGHQDHLYSFSIDCIKRLLDRTGFRVEKVIFDVNFVGRFPIFTPFLYVANFLPPIFVIWWSNAVWIVARKNDRI